MDKLSTKQRQKDNPTKRKNKPADTQANRCADSLKKNLKQRHTHAIVQAFSSLLGLFYSEFLRKLREEHFKYHNKSMSRIHI